MAFLNPFTVVDATTCSGSRFHPLITRWLKLSCLMFNLDRGLVSLREFPLVIEVFSSKRLFTGMLSNPLSTCILNVSIRSPRCLLSSRVVRFKYFSLSCYDNELFRQSTWLLYAELVLEVHLCLKTPPQSSVFTTNVKA